MTSQNYTDNFFTYKVQKKLAMPNILCGNTLNKYRVPPITNISTQTMAPHRRAAKATMKATGRGVVEGIVAAREGRSLKRTRLQERFFREMEIVLQCCVCRNLQGDGNPACFARIDRFWCRKCACDPQISPHGASIHKQDNESRQVDHGEDRLTVH